MVGATGRNVVDVSRLTPMRQSLLLSGRGFRPAKPVPAKARSRNSLPLKAEFQPGFCTGLPEPGFAGDSQINYDYVIFLTKFEQLPYRHRSNRKFDQNRTTFQAIMSFGQKNNQFRRKSQDG
jgi:hypothetical protein